MLFVKDAMPIRVTATITITFQNNNLTFGINLTEDYHHIEKETIKNYLQHLRPTSTILGYTLEISDLIKKEPEINSYYIENGFIHIELKHNTNEKPNQDNHDPKLELKHTQSSTTK
ncbi:MAG: hypothetical protein ACXQTI_03115 [Candidatus Nezhaarchaeales archaeon]